MDLLSGNARGDGGLSGAEAAGDGDGNGIKATVIHSGRVRARRSVAAFAYSLLPLVLVAPVLGEENYQICDCRRPEKSAECNSACNNQPGSPQVIVFPKRPPKSPIFPGTLMLPPELMRVEAARREIEGHRELWEQKRAAGALSAGEYQQGIEDYRSAISAYREVVRDLKSKNAAVR